MKVLVAYIDDAYSPTVRELKRVLGSDFEPAPLPYVSEPIHSEMELKRRLRHLSEIEEGSNVVVQDSVHHIEMSDRRAMECVKRDHEWSEFLGDWATTEDLVSLQARGQERCWVVLAELTTGGMPPGVIFLVDKATERVFARRYVDLVHLFHELEEPPER